MSQVPVTVQLKTNWCAPANCWIVDVNDENGVPIVAGMAMVTGADLLEQFQYLGLGFQMIVQSDNNPDEVPSYTTLGKTGHLFIPSP